MGKLYKSKINVALTVLSCFETVLERFPTEVGDFSVETYSNCREQGFAIKVWNKETLKNKTASFSENRNSDDIVVYVGYDFDGYNVPSEEAYKKAKYFRYDKAYAAAKYMFEELNKN